MRLRTLALVGVASLLLGPSLQAPSASAARVRSAKQTVTTPEARRIAAGTHDGNLFTPKISPDSKWVAYGIQEELGDRTKLSWFRRELDGGAFKSIWPNQHPSLREGEGTASFSDLVQFSWHPSENQHAMVARHKEDANDVMLEFIDVRFGGPGNQHHPVFSPDGFSLIVAGKSERSDELFLADAVHGATIQRLTWTRDFEQNPSWHPKKGKVLHEIRANKKSDLFVIDLETFRHEVLLRLPKSDEIHPIFSPAGDDSYAFLTNKNYADRESYDLFVGKLGTMKSTLVISGVRKSVHGPGYVWDPEGRFLVAVQDETDDLVIAPADASIDPVSLGFKTKGNTDPTLLRHEGIFRMAWIGDDSRKTRGRAGYQIVWTADWNAMELPKLAGFEPIPVGITEDAPAPE
jgi:Tol biopolymer transport system component